MINLAIGEEVRAARRQPGRGRIALSDEYVKLLDEARAASGIPGWVVAFQDA